MSALSLLDSAVLTGVTGVLTAVVTAAGTWLVMARQKAPDQQAAITSAVEKIVGHYITALKGAEDQIAALRLTVERQTATIDELTETIGELEIHVDTLTRALDEAGVPSPTRKRRVRNAQEAP